MSSSYSALCLAHDPALHIGPDFTYAEVERMERLARLDGDSHRYCDVIVGRWSGGLIELACTGLHPAGSSGPIRQHSDIRWIDADWLRLLHAAHGVVDAKLLDQHAFRCWPHDRIHRLRYELGINETSTAA